MVPHTRTRPKACRPSSRRIARLTEIMSGNTAVPTDASAAIAIRMLPKSLR